MRVVSWNCNGALRRKFSQLDELNADLVVVQECENPTNSTADYKQWAADFAWKGYPNGKGIGIFPRRGQSIEPLAWANGGFELFLPVKVAGLWEILAVWTQDAKPRSWSYIGQLNGYLELNSHRLGSTTVVVGDFNSNVQWDGSVAHGNHRTCVSTLEDRGLVSLYHYPKMQPQGDEPDATFFLQRNLEKPLHIDYVFAHSATIVGVNGALEVGNPERWLPFSDHMPMVFELLLPGHLEPAS